MTVKPKKQSSLRRMLARRGLLLTNLGFIFLLLISYLTEYISPQHVWWTELFALTYGTLLSINLIFIVFWAILRKRYFSYSLIAVLIGFSRIFGIFQFRFHEHSTIVPDHSAEHPQLKVMSYNVHLFDLYNWNHNTETRAKIFSALQKESPDIICFQEFFSTDRTDYSFENADALKHVLSASYSHIAYTVNLNKGDHFGIATYSKFPIINRKVIYFQGHNGNIFIYTDIVANADTFRVFNTHLESDRFQPADYRFVEDFDIGKNEQSQVKGIRKRVLSIVHRLKNGAIIRSQQAPMMADYIAKSPYPVIVCGDFNDIPSSYVYSKISDNLKDAFRESGSGFGQTYIGAFPSFRIDYILHDRKIKSTGYHTSSDKLSDHYPISCFVQRE